jgi:hypothetical protein
MKKIYCYAAGSHSLLGTAVINNLTFNEEFTIIVNNFISGIDITEEIKLLKKHFPEAKVIQE